MNFSLLHIGTKATYINMLLAILDIPTIAAHLTAVFETGAMLTPTKSQSGTNCG